MLYDSNRVSSNDSGHVRFFWDGNFAGISPMLAVDSCNCRLIPAAEPEHVPRLARVRPERPFDAEFDDGRMHNHDVVAKQFQENLVPHGRVRLAPNVVAELGFDHAERALDVRPLMVVG